MHGAKKMKGIIEINGLRVRARHGVLDEERTLGNNFEISVTLGYPFGDAAREDNLEATLNYAEATDIIIGVMATPSRLLEHVAWRIREALTTRWPAIESGVVRIAKLNPPIDAQLRDVAVRIEW